MKFALGVLLGVLVGAGGMWLFKVRGKAEPPAAAAAKEVGPVASADKGKGGKGKGKRRAGARRGGGDFSNDPSGMGEEGPADEPVPVLTEDDLRIGAEGDKLTKRPANVDLSADAPDQVGLSQDDINSAVNGVASSIIACIEEARGNAPVTGRITAGVVVAPDGKVLKSRVEAPVYLLRHGFGKCARRQLGSMRFPPPGADTIVTVPFDVQ